MRVIQSLEELVAVFGQPYERLDYNLDPERPVFVVRVDD